MKKLTATFLIIVTAIFSNNTAFAAAEYFSPTDVGTSAEMIGKGGVEGFSSSATLIFENPASLYQVKNGSVSIFNTSFFNELFYTNVALVTKLPKKWGRLGVGYMDATVSGIPYTGVMNNSSKEFYQISEFEYRNSLLKAAYQYDISDNWHAGAAILLYKNGIYDVSGSGKNMELGLAWDKGPFAAAFGVRNILSTGVDYSGGSSSGKSENLPKQITLSGRYVYKQYEFLGQIKRAQSQNLKSLAIGYHPNFLPMLELFLGYHDYPVLDQTKSTVSLGLGLTFLGTKFNYAYEPGDHIEYTGKHYFSLGFNF